MSSSLTLIVLGQVYFLGPMSNVSLNGTDSVIVNPRSEINPGISEPDPIPETRRNDYTYTPRLGAHKIHTQATNWNSARKICMTEGGHLAIINSRAESELIAGLVANSGNHVGSADSNYVHIGFHDLYREGEFVTVNGEPLDIVGFNEWQGGGPNNDGNEDCGSIYRNGKLNDIGCEKSVGFVCELPQN